MRNSPVPLAFDDGKSFLEFNVIPEQTFAVGEMAREKKGGGFKKEPCTSKIKQSGKIWKDQNIDLRPTAVSAPVASRHMASAIAQDESPIWNINCM